MIKIKTLTLAFGLMLGASAFAQQDLKPDIFFPDPSNGACLYGISDNGEWGVANQEAGESGFAEFSGAVLFDLRTIPAKKTNLTKGQSFGSAYDVTDDGLAVVGSVNRKPAVFKFEDGEWKAHVLPIPDREFRVRNVYTDSYDTYKLNGGEVFSVTPDGKYGVGMVGCNEYIQIEVGCMWNLETYEMIPLPGLGLENSSFSRLTEISADGRYVLARAGGYKLYDRETGKSISSRVGLDIYAQGLSPNGRYLSGVVSRGDFDYAAYYDVQEDKLTVIDGDANADAVAWTTTNDGVPLVSRPHISPYADGYVWHDGFMYSFEEILTQVYGINLRNYNIDNTGKPFQVSADGRTIVMLIGPGDSYVLRLKEDIRDAVERVDLFKGWTASPTPGIKMTSIGTVTINFKHPVVADEMASSMISLLDSKGNVVANPLANGGVTTKNNTLTIQFRTRTMNPDEEYTLRIPAGTISINGREKSKNVEMNLKYIGRENVPVKPTDITPKDGAAIATIDLNENPIVVTFDNQVKVNVPLGGERPVATFYIDDETTPVAYANMDVDLYTGNKLVVFPASTVPLYKGSEYKVVIPQGAVVDMSGNGASEEIVVNYTGTYVPQLGDEKYLFYSDCNDYTNWLFYDGDHGTPTAEYAAMFFEADTTPWAVVMETETSTDMSFGSHSCYTDGRASDDWVTTRQILIPEDGETYLAFDSQSYRRLKQDYLKVYVYENNTILNSLNASIISDIKKNADLVYNDLQSPGATEAYLTGEWTHNVIDLTPYAGKSVYICFHNDNQNQSMVIIDNVEVVKEVKAFLTLRNETSLVNASDVNIWGMLSVSSEMADYHNVNMTLKDGNGNTVSTISESGLNLKYGDAYNFRFPDNLKLEAGVENPYTISYTLDGDALEYNGVIRNLTFRPTKRVVIEEFTGRDCQFCPGGLVTMEHIEGLFGNQVIPIALHCYNGSDPKGVNVMGYWEFTGMNGAPQARINRGPVAGPLYQTANGYVNTGADIPDNVTNEKLWKDYVVEELQEPALMDITLSPNESRGNNLNFTAKIRSAISLTDQNLRVFGVLLEDGLTDYQVNAYYATSDPLLGEWGKDGIYGQATVYPYIFNNVARSVWGQSYNGTPGLLPTVINSSEEYEINISIQVPNNVVDVANCKLVVMIIDENTGKVINAARSMSLTGLDSMKGETADMNVDILNGEINVTAGEPVNAMVYTPSGVLLASANGEGQFSINLNGYKGIAIVKVTGADASVTKKLMVR